MCCDQHENISQGPSSLLALKAEGHWWWWRSQHVARLWKWHSLWHRHGAQVGEPLFCSWLRKTCHLSWGIADCITFFCLSLGKVGFLSLQPCCALQHPISRGTEVEVWSLLWCLTLESLISVWHQLSIISAQALLWFLQHKHGSGTTDKGQRGQSRNSSISRVHGQGIAQSMLLIP